MKIKRTLRFHLTPIKMAKVFYIDDEGNATDMNAVREDDYMVFETDHFSRYIITFELEPVTSLVWLIGVMAGLLALGAAMVVVRFVMAKKSQKKALAEGEEKESDKSNK